MAATRLQIVAAVAGVALLAVGVGLVVVGRRTAPLPADHATTIAVPSAATSSVVAPTPQAPPTTTLPFVPPNSPVPEGGDEQDRLAARPMPAAGASAFRPGPVSTRDPGTPILLPDCPDVGPAHVATGCPHTASGALAAMAAIDQAALQSLSMAGVRAVIAAWAVPGGPSTTTWSGVAVMADLLTKMAGHPGPNGNPAGAVLVLTPVMGLIKGSVGADFVVPCVDFVLQLTVTATGRVAIADCERMVWVDGRWMIGPGPEPAQPPSVWPDSDAAIAAGYRDLVHV